MQCSLCGREDIAPLMVLTSGNWSYSPKRAFCSELCADIWWAELAAIPHWAMWYVGVACETSYAVCV